MNDAIRDCPDASEKIVQDVEAKSLIEKKGNEYEAIVYTDGDFPGPRERERERDG